MSLLDHLWDDTVAGPLPDSGLGKLRKNATFSSRSDSGKESIRKSFEEDASETGVRVTRSIMIVKRPQNNLDSPPISPAGATPPVSPFSGHHRFRRRSGSFPYEKEGGIGSGNSPPPYNL
ncbi:drm3-like protein [Genlisea aurea]|uniref:Drm3-like protein n=1 Tax=Genlisea aurea TaxID=192259 RepID=S8DIL2_9LAMI|nr:drm3-like protein [Genlisea aurea]